MEETFLLAEESELFSQISQNVKRQPNLVVGCQKVEVKVVSSSPVHAVETHQHVVKLERGIERCPQTVEIVELVEERDVNGDNDDYEDDEEEEGEYSVCEGTVYKSSRKKQKIEDHDRNIEARDARASNSVLLEVTDLINRTEEAIVTACNSSNVYDVGKSVKEVKLKKEVQVSRTYQIVGNYEKCCVNSPTVDECESFYGSDKETDDIVMFSEEEEEDKGTVDRNNSSSSSADDFYSTCRSTLDSSALEVGLNF